VISLPGSESTTRGIDEAARVDDQLYISLRPMLAVSGGRLVALSTPYGTRGWWHAAWTSGEDWERYQIPAKNMSANSPRRRTMSSTLQMQGVAQRLTLGGRLASRVSSLSLQGEFAFAPSDEGVESEREDRLRRVD
jgi:hypothetical protein